MPKKANGMARSATMTIANQPDILSLRVCSIGQAESGRSRAVYPLAAARGGEAPSDGSRPMGDSLPCACVAFGNTPGKRLTSRGCATHKKVLLPIEGSWMG